MKQPKLETTYWRSRIVDLGADSAEDTVVSTAALQQKADSLIQQLAETSTENLSQQAELQLRLANVEVDLQQQESAWINAFEALQFYVSEESWESAAIACDIMFRTDHPKSLAALGHGVWLSVTYPVTPTATIALLRHIIDETPDDADGAAVAAATAAYISDLRGPDNGDLSLETGQLLNSVARRHANVHTQEEFDQWFKKLELDQPTQFLPRLRNVIDVLVQDDWWIDREGLQARLPIN